jgi:hypothetical protein
MTTPPDTALPRTEDTPLLRTDFTDQKRWEAVREAIETPNEDDFHAYVEYLDDPAYRHLTPEQILAPVPEEFQHAIVIVADTAALASPEMPLLVIDVADVRGRAVRVIAEELWSIENNLSIANMDFEDFLGSADEDGVFHGF